jgi:signal transduction histidine kinase
MNLKETDFLIIGGYLWAESESGEGATFSVLLPAE